MHHKEKQDCTGNSYLEVNQVAFDLIRNPLLNKGSAFNDAEREEFKMLGLLPPVLGTLEAQRARS